MSSELRGVSAADDLRIALSAAHIGLLFPFHVIFDEGLRILHNGEKLAQLCPLLTISDLFSDHFEICRPNRVNGFPDICQQLGALFIVRLRSSAIELRGQMVLLEPNRVMFVCSPLVRSITEVEKLGRSLQDFPLHDPTGDLLFLLQAQRATIEDAKALNARLFTLTQALKRYVPEDLLSQLNKESIAHVQLGDHVQKILTVLFSDIRSFASLAENMSPRETFDFINGYLREMEPVVLATAASSTSTLATRSWRSSAAHRTTR